MFWKQLRPVLYPNPSHTPNDIHGIKNSTFLALSQVPYDHTQDTLLWWDTPGSLPLAFHSIPLACGMGMRLGMGRPYPHLVSFPGPTRSSGLGLGMRLMHTWQWSHCRPSTHSRDPSCETCTKNTCDMLWEVAMQTSNISSHIAGKKYPTSVYWVWTTS